MRLWLRGDRSDGDGDGDEELVTRAQIHAREVHGIQLSAELVLRLAKATTERPDG